MILLKLLTSATKAVAYNGQSAIDWVSQGFASFPGIEGLDSFIQAIWANSSVLVYSIAIIVVAVSGLEMVISQSDDSTAKARRTLIGSIAGLIVLTLSHVIRNAILNIGGGGDPTASILNEEIIGVVDFITSILGAVIILMLLINGITAILQFGNGEGLSILRRTILNVVVGIVIIAIREIFVDSWYVSRNPRPFVDALVGYVNDFLVFIGVIAVLVIIYAGILMIVNGGNEDQFVKARNLIARAVIGLLIILLAAAIVNAIFTGVA